MTQRHIWVSADINQRTENTFVSYVLDEANKGADEFFVYLTTTGGSPYNGMNLYGFLKARSERFVVWNMSRVDSAGIPFFLGFQDRRSAPLGRFLLHESVFHNDLPQKYTANHALAKARDLQALNEQMHTLITSETTWSRAQVDQMAASSTVLNLEQARSFGLIKAVETPAIPSQGVVHITE